MPVNKAHNEKMITDILSIKNAKIRYRNFEGRQTNYNPAGQRNFCVLLDEDNARALKADGWNVKWPKPRDEDEEVIPFLQVKVAFESKYPPKVVLITGRNQTELNADTVKRLDAVQLKRVDLSIRPYNWDVNGQRGVKAYLRTLYATLVEDEIEEMYRLMAEEKDYGDESIPPWEG